MLDPARLRVSVVCHISDNSTDSLGLDPLSPSPSPSTSPSSRTLLFQVDTETFISRVLLALKDMYEIVAKITHSTDKSNTGGGGGVGVDEHEPDVNDEVVHTHEDGGRYVCTRNVTMRYYALLCVTMRYYALLCVTIVAMYKS